MPRNVKWALMLAILLWSSAFVGIRAALHGYSPGGLALFRYAIASICMGAVYFYLPERKLTSIKDKIQLLFVGAIGIGVYNITLNSGELTIESGMASFIISMAPVITALFATIFLRERLSLFHALGMIISIAGIVLIAVGEKKGFHWNNSLGFILLATLSGSCYTVMQKPFVGKYHIIEVTTYAIWGGALFLLLYSSQLLADFHHASFISTATVIYLGIFPAAVGYLAWSFVLTKVDASRAVTYLYFQPFIVTLLGWAYLGEVPVILSFIGGILAIAGVWFVNQGYQSKSSVSTAAVILRESGGSI